MPLLNITNSFNAYDVVTIEGGVATLLDITTTPSGIVGVVITNNYIAIDEQLQIDTRQWNEGDKLYCNADSRIINIQPIDKSFNQPIGVVIKKNILGSVFIYSSNYQFMSLQFTTQFQEEGFPFGITRGTNGLTTLNNNNIFPLLAIKLAGGYTATNIKLIDFSITCTSTSSYNYYLILNPTITGVALSFTQVTGSNIEAQTNTTNATTLTNGTILYTGVSTQTNEGGLTITFNPVFNFGSIITSASDVLVLGVQRVTGNTETFFASLNFKEIY